MRIPLLIFPLVLAACAGSGAGESSMTRDFKRLMAECEARGGILLPSGTSTGRPAEDNICEIRDGFSAKLR